MKDCQILLLKHMKSWSMLELHQSKSPHHSDPGYGYIRLDPFKGKMLELAQFGVRKVPTQQISDQVQQPREML
ncbi:hypothetical protein INR49_018240 [Caranx melampygus]|nr:hypothetical protein INR49_018240 [Caranx melampygus]